VRVVVAEDECVGATPAALERENAKLREQVAERDAKLANREAELAEFRELLDKLKRDNVLLSNELLRLKRSRFAAKADRFPDDLNGLFAHLLGEEVVEQPDSVALEAPDVELPEDPTPKKARRQRRRQRELDYQALPRETVRHELPEAERTCPITGKQLVPVGVKSFEELRYEPARVVVVVHEQVQYGLSEEDRKERTAPMIVAPMPPRAIDGALADAGLLARVLVAKYAEHLPLHRQEAIFEREGFWIPRQTLCEWTMRSAQLLLPIAAALKRILLASGILQCDDTQILCLENSIRGGRRWAYLWVWIGEEPRAVVYDFTLGRGTEVVSDWIGSDWSGFLVGDGLAQYGKLCRERDPKYPIVEVGCWAHARRKVKEAANDAPEDALHVAALIRQLYDVETEAKERGLSPEERRELRRKESLPVLWRMRKLVRDLRPKYTEGEGMWTALSYIKNQWRTLRQYVKDGRLPIDNNGCEQAIRPIAVGRKSWMFTGSPRGGELGAAIYSIVESARRSGVNVFEYLRDVLVRVRVHPTDRMDELVPWRWQELREAGQLRPLGI
jgi:transposase